jgi:molybdopterin/thiamine biosynthesis adenylyltransferase
VITLMHKTLCWFRWNGIDPPSGSLPALRGWESGWQNLAAKSVMMCGLGAVGGVAFELLARLGVGDLMGVDPGRYEELSWTTQPMSATDAGRLKALVQGERAHAANPQVRVRTAVGLAQELPLRRLSRADVLVTAGDNLELLVWAGVKAAALGKPLLQGAVHGETWTAIVRGFDLRQPNSACPACILGERDWSRLHSRAGCDPASVLATSLEPTRTLPTVCGTAGHLLATEALKWLVAPDEQSLRGKELTFCLRTHRVWRTDLPRSTTCRCPHERWRVEDLEIGSKEITLALLARRSGQQIRELQVRAEMPWIRFSLCEACGRQVPARRFARPGAAAGHCCCGAVMIAGSVGMCSVMPSEDLLACQDTPLDALGLSSGDAVGISGEEGWSYFVFPEAPEENEDADREQGEMQ